MGILRKSEIDWSNCGELVATLRALRAWYRAYPGKWLQDSELSLLKNSVSDLFGYHILQIGLNNERDCLNESRIPHRMVM
ncbi:hypothetical protein, partial [Kaarinaea lacus]